MNLLKKETFLINGWSSSVFHLWSISEMILSITSLSFSSFDKSSTLSPSFDVMQITLWIIWIWISRNWHQRDESKNDSVFSEDNIDLRLEINIFNPFKSRLSWLFLNQYKIERIKIEFSCTYSLYIFICSISSTLAQL